jgi:O-antigen ligase
VQHAHNDYLEFWIDYGPIGLAAFLALSAWLLSAAWRPEADAAAWAGAAALLAIALVDFPFHRPAEWGLYWLLLEMCEINAARNQRSIGECHSQPNEF